VTVNFVDAVVVPSVAVIVVVPTEVAVTRPELSIVATSGFEELQMICVVRSFAVWWEEMPVAMHCSVVPIAILGFVGVIATGCNTTLVSFVFALPPPPPPPQEKRTRDREKNNA
jgi:hypothetical protein